MPTNQKNNFNLVLAEHKELIETVAKISNLSIEEIIKIKETL